MIRSPSSMFAGVAATSLKPILNIEPNWYLRGTWTRDSTWQSKYIFTLTVKFTFPVFTKFGAAWRVDSIWRRRRLSCWLFILIKMETEVENMKVNSFSTAKLETNFSERSYFSWKICSDQEIRKESGTNFTLPY